MSKFKPGDKVVLINVDHYSDIMKQLLGKALVVRTVDNDRCGCEIVCAGIPGEEGWFLYSDDLRLVSETQDEPTDPAPAAAKKPQPLRRGDLVVSNGGIYVVIETNHADGGYWIHAMTGKGGQDYAKAKELTRVGSIRKKIKRLQAQMEECK